MLLELQLDYTLKLRLCCSKLSPFQFDVQDFFVIYEHVGLNDNKLCKYSKRDYKIGHR